MEIYLYISETFIALTFISFAFVLLDLYRHPQSIAIMDGIWAITVLWSGLIGFICYIWFGRSKLSHKGQVRKVRRTFKDQEGHIHDEIITEENVNKREQIRAERKRIDDFAQWKKNVLSILGVGALCAVGIIVGEMIGVTLFPVITPIGTVLQWIINFVMIMLASILLSMFVYLTRRKTTKFKSMGQAISFRLRRDFISLIIWQLGFIIIAAILVVFIMPNMSHGSPAYWFDLQLAMFGGFAVTFIRRKNDNASKQ